jgi:hypothetical protein
MEPQRADESHRLHTRVVLIIDDATGEIDYFILHDRADLIVLEAPLVAVSLCGKEREIH